MSIAGFISEVWIDGSDVILALKPRPEKRDIVGQYYLTIRNATWVPNVGLEIWGGSNSVIIEADPYHEYERVTLTELEEIRKVKPTG